MNVPANASFSPLPDESPVGPAEDETDDLVSSLLPYMGVTMVVAVIVLATLIAATVHVLHLWPR
jgi:hypothetical protein